MVMAVFAYGQQNANPQKYALVIGNGQYTNFGSLRNAVNDANDMAEALQGLGFTVDKLLDGNLTQMENAAVRLKDRLTSAGNNAYGFFYYAGHGVQVDGVNYLIPANANIPDKDFLRERAISAQTVLDMLNRAKNALNIVVLDACRDFPAAWSRSTDRGLAVMHPPTDSIIMYATGAGRTASDNPGGRNGLFTTQLLRHLKTPGIEVNELFRRTMSDVARVSNNEQRPALYTDFAETAYLGARPVAAAPVGVPQHPEQAGTATPFSTGNNITTSQANWAMIGKATQELAREGFVATQDSLTFNQKVRVVNEKNGKEVEVTIVGRSRSIRTDRIIDLSADAWEALGLTEDNQVMLLESSGPEGTYR